MRGIFLCKHLTHLHKGSEGYITVAIAKVCELRYYDVEGYRETILFLYRYFSSCFTEDAEEALSRALELNAMFKNPLVENEVIQDTKSATRVYENRLYKYTNTKLIEILDITLDEQQHLITIISDKEKYRRCAEEKKAKRRNETRRFKLDNDSK